jgi:FAD/FMN-containing dehydrogenase
MGGKIFSGIESLSGSNNISSESTMLELYAKDLSFTSGRKPAAVVWPAKKEAIQGIVKWANEKKIPLVPVSSGGPHFRGDTVPQIGGGLIVDLSKLDNIIRINKRNRVMIIEPGVTYEKIQPELKKHGLRLITPLKPKKNKSVLGSVLEREPGIAPRYQWDVSDPLCCMEVVFGTGDSFRTGEAAGPGGMEAQWKINGAQKFPNGPHQLDYHRLIQGSQGSLGIATWASVKCELLPTISVLHFIPVDDIRQLANYTADVMGRYLGEEYFILNAISAATLIGNTKEEIQSLRQSLPKFTAIHIINGMERHPEERVEYQIKDMHDIAQKFGLNPVKRVNGCGSGKMMKILNTPSGDVYWKHVYKGGCQDIFFISKLDHAAKYIDIMNTEAKNVGYPTNDIGIYIQPMVQGTSCHVEFQLPYDPSDKAEAEKVKGLMDITVKELVKAGAFFSRPYPGWAYEVYRNRGDIVGPLKKVKTVFDPNNIMNPGKLCF